MRFAIGEAVVDVIVDDGDYELPLSGFLPGLDQEGLARHLRVLEPEFLDVARDRLRVAVQSYVVRTGGRTILIDSCVGDDRDRPEIPVWNQRHATGFLERLRQAGTHPAAIDLVFCSHLHVDHVGWNTRLSDGRFVPTFPNARYLFGRDELADWMAQREAGTIPALHGAAIEDSVVPILEAGLADLVDTGHELARGLTLTPASRPHPRPDGRPGRATRRPGDLLRRRDSLPGPDLPAGRFDGRGRRPGGRDRDPARAPRWGHRDRPPGDPGAFPRATLRPHRARRQRVRAGVRARPGLIRGPRAGHH